MTTNSVIRHALLAAMLLGPRLALGGHEVAEASGTPREQLVARFDHMPEAALAADFLSCDRQARMRMLSQDEGVRCAMAWDALLRRVFAGDIGALIAWWQVHRDGSGRE